MAFDTAQTFRFEPVMVRSGTVCSAFTVDAHDFVKLIVMLAATPITRDEIAATVTGLVARFASPTRVEVRELGDRVQRISAAPCIKRSIHCVYTRSV